jgi:hypothetical protein
MSSKIEPTTSKRELSGALAATLGLIALACNDDGDDSSPSTGGKSSGGAGKSGAGEAGMRDDSVGGSPVADGGGGAGGVANEAADVAPLNALLAAEYNAITAYGAGAGLIGAAPETDALYELADVISKIAMDIQAQHELHAQALVAAIETLGGTPVQRQTVAKAFTPPQRLVENPTITNVLKFAAGAERSAAVAYNQVLAGLEASQHRFLAASIEGDESQHFIVLAALVLGLASPGPRLDLETAADVVPQAFVSAVGAEPGLEAGPADYFP